MFSRLQERPTPDLVIIFLTGIVGMVVVVFAVAIMYITIAQPDHEVGTLAIRLAAIVNTLIGAIVGYVAGRGASRNGNGNGSTKRE